MYTDIRGVQILISLLKQFNIHHIVLSPGTRNAALAHSVETDDFFVCYSIVDERSAGYFALGLSEALDEPVCVSCTAATATSNYMPSVKEAYERKIQLVVLTADQDLYGMFNMEDQTINQIDMYHDYIKYAVDVPMIKDARDEWYFNRCVNEALLELNHHGKGPVQINYRMAYSLDQLSTFPVKELPIARKITRYEDEIPWDSVLKELSIKKKILVIGGSYYCTDDTLKNTLDSFFHNFNVAIIADIYANERDNCVLNPLAMGEVVNNENIDLYAPDLIITFGNVFYATFKNFIPRFANKTEHWQIAIDGRINDGYRCLTRVYECSAEKFFSNLTSSYYGTNDKQYYGLWKNRLDKFIFPDLKFTNFKVIQEFCKKLPEKVLLHTSVLDAIRISNYMKVSDSIKCFANIGADGIDGALSTFLGQASVDENLSYLLIGDLSFMYDMNALICKITPNVRIIVINNYSGAEFHKNFGVERISTLDLHIAAGHNTKIQQCAQMAKIKYLSADNETSLQTALAEFNCNSLVPIILEVFTDADLDAKTLKQYWALNRTTTTKGKIKESIKSIIGTDNTKRLNKLLNR